MTQLDEAGSADAAGTGDAREGGAPVQMFINDIPFGFDLTEDGVIIDGDATISDAL
jgi:hypothetical protein